MENTPALAAKNYPDFPLIILSQAERSKSRASLRTLPEIIGLRFRQAITSFMQKDGCAGACT